MFSPRLTPESVFYTKSVIFSPRFIPESVFYTKSVIFSPRFIPESVFYTHSVVRSPCFILTASRCEVGRVIEFLLYYNFDFFEQKI